MHPIAESAAWILVAATASSASPREILSAPEVRAIADKILTVRIAPDLSGLGEGERAALAHLLRAGAVLQDLYEHQLHRDARAARAALLARHARQRSDDTRARLDLYRVFKGPVAVTLDNRVVPFLEVDARPPGRNVYPWGITREQMGDPAPGLLDPMAVVREVGDGTLSADLGRLEDHAELRALHPSLAGRLRGAADRPRGTLFAVPYAVAYFDELRQVRSALGAAAAAVAEDDPDFADYLRLRALDLLSNDYEAGDAAWVSGSFRNLNAQIGAYETYDDALFGTKAFFGMSVLLRDARATAQLERGLGSLQSIEDALPYERHQKVRDRIPVAVYEVIADFGQARGTNTATILPNDAAHARKYGRTILIRANILRHPELFETARATFEACVADEHHADLDADGGFLRTLWHEVGHYLGPKTARDGRPHGEALRELSDLFEELKADLVSLFSIRRLGEAGVLAENDVKSALASGVLRVLQKVKPRREQPYQTMQLMQWNYFLEHGLLEFDRGLERLRIRYDRYDAVVSSMLERVLSIQDAGDHAAAVAFVDRYGVWDEDLHGICAASARAAERARFRKVEYAALGE